MDEFYIELGGRDVVQRALERIDLSPGSDLSHQLRSPGFFTEAQFVRRSQALVDTAQQNRASRLLTPVELCLSVLAGQVGESSGMQVSNSVQAALGWGGEEA